MEPVPRIFCLIILQKWISYPWGVISNEANDVAKQTASIANTIVEDADKKEFIGKDKLV